MGGLDSFWRDEVFVHSDSLGHELLALFSQSLTIACFAYLIAPILNII